MRAFVVMLLCTGAIIAATAPARVRELSFRKLPLRDGERIAAIQVDLTGATFSKVSIPYDWGFDISPPVADACTLKGTAQHGSAFLSANQLQKFATLAFYASPESPFTIRASVLLYSYDQKSQKESQRTIDLPKECIVLE
jgi:hypothetical protein